MNHRFRFAGGRPFFFASFLGLAAVSFAAAHGCTGGQVDPPNGDNDDGGKEDPDPERDAGGDPVVEDTLTAVIAAIEDGNLESTFTLDGSSSLNPGGRVVEYLWEVETPEGEGCEGALVNSAAPVTTFTPGCRGEHVVTLTLSLTDDSVSSQVDATFSVDNRVPVLGPLSADGAFLPGDDVVIRATVSDEDDVDAPTCTARLADDNTGDPTGLVIPSEPSAACSFTITTPPRVDTWKVVVVATDGHDDSLPATIELTAGNEPPVISSVVANAAAVEYACADGACASSVVRVTVTASDDSDAFEELAIALADVTAGAPDGATVTVTPVDGFDGVFDVVVSREDLGALAGSYTLEASVTEVTAGEDGPATVTRQVGFDVTNAAPVLGTVTADDVSHAYVSETDTYTATVTVSATATDPEANALLTAIALVSCPTAAVGEAACGGAELSIEETTGEGSLELALETADLSKLAGEYAFAITVTDPDGAVVGDEPTLAVLNLPPVMAPGFTSPVQQTYNGGVHTALTPLFHDPDGDPVEATLSATCPDTTSASLPGNCGSGQQISVAAGVLTVSGPATGLLGDYAVTGTVTDGAAPLDINTTLRIENSPPTLTRTSPEIHSQHHKTSGGTVTNASFAFHGFAGEASDSNGDPLTFSAFLDPASGYTMLGSGFTGEQVDDDGVVEFVFGLSTTFENFVATFENQTQRVVVEVTDPFGALGTSGMNPRLNNRSPTVSSKAFRNTAGTSAPPILQNTEFEGRIHDGVFTNFARYYNCQFSCNVGSAYRFAVDVNATDPDGDPLEAELDLGCSDTVERYPSGSVSAFQPLPANGLIQLMIEGSVGFCSGFNPDSFREWETESYLNCGGGLCVLTPYFGCALDASDSRVTDGIADITLGSDISRDFGIADTSTPYTCE